MRFPEIIKNESWTLKNYLLAVVCYFFNEILVIDKLSLVFNFFYETSMFIFGWFAHRMGVIKIKVFQGIRIFRNFKADTKSALEILTLETNYLTRFSIVLFLLEKTLYL